MPKASANLDTAVAEVQAIPSTEGWGVTGDQHHCVVHPAPYQHTAEADQKIANTLGQQIENACDEPSADAARQG